LTFYSGIQNDGVTDGTDGTDGGAGGSFVFEFSATAAALVFGSGFLYVFLLTCTSAPSATLALALLACNRPSESFNVAAGEKSGRLNGAVRIVAVSSS